MTDSLPPVARRLSDLPSALGRFAHKEPYGSCRGWEDTGMDDRRVKTVFLPARTVGVGFLIRELGVSPLTGRARKDLKRITPRRLASSRAVSSPPRIEQWTPMRIGFKGYGRASFEGSASGCSRGAPSFATRGNNSKNARTRSGHERRVRASFKKFLLEFWQLGMIGENEFFEAIEKHICRRPGRS